MYENEIPAGTAAPANTRHRSPNYPSVSLVKAIELAGRLYEQNRMATVAGAVACKLWGVKITSSSGMRLLSAMQAFGLIEVQGAGDARAVKLTDRSRVLARHPDRSSAEYRDALRAAAQAPKLHAELLAKYGASGLPSDEALRWALENELKFHPDSLDDVIEEVR